MLAYIPYIDPMGMITYCKSTDVFRAAKLRPVFRKAEESDRKAMAVAKELTESLAQETAHGTLILGTNTKPVDFEWEAKKELYMRPQVEAHGKSLNIPWWFFSIKHGGGDTVRYHEDYGYDGYPPDGWDRDINETELWTVWMWKSSKHRDITRGRFTNFHQLFKTIQKGFDLIFNLLLSVMILLSSFFWVATTLTNMDECG